MLDHDNLEAFADPANYDRADSSDTGVAFYSDLARETGGPILEIACGTGRVALPIARLGYAVTGLDIVPGMLVLARRKSAGLPVRWVEGDARTFDLGERFRLIYMTGNAFQAFVTNAEQAALLQRVHAHLAAEGFFAFETRNPLLPGVKMPAGGFVPLETRPEERSWPSYINVDGHEVCVSTTQVYDHVAQVVHLTGYERWHDGSREQTKITRTALRYTFPQELAALLRANGFTCLRCYGDWDKGPLVLNSPSIISVCMRA
ncbi:MAG: class I SAM-dependent methyltransferase [Caldilineaceae bacterium]|nr:class I SAM-dependent methyltransferase [Caldilineaceae bacterium]